MIFAVILAGGTGSRMGSTDMPKQFLEIKGKPILNHTIEKFLPNPRFEKIIVLSPKAWIGHTKELVRKHTGKNNKIAVIEGGATRNDTIMNAINYIDREYGLDDDTVIVTHDSVRPFVTHRIIDENIKTALSCGACDTVIPATGMYQGQTPQSFKAKLLRDSYNSLTDDEKEILTDAAKILVMKGIKVKLVQGETFNIKITYPYDLKIARSLLDEETE